LTIQSLHGGKRDNGRDQQSVNDQPGGEKKLSTKWGGSKERWTIRTTMSLEIELWEKKAKRKIKQRKDLE